MMQADTSCDHESRTVTVHPKSSLDFWASFAGLLSEQREEFYRVWLVGQRKSRGGQWKDKPFTEFLERVLYPGVGAKLGLIVRSKGNGGEVSRFDATFYSPGSHADPCLQDAAIVLEHENKRNDQTREVEKLAETDAPLRVLIFYTKPDLLSTALTSIAHRIGAANIPQGDLLAIWGEAEAPAGPTYRGFQLLGESDWHECGRVFVPRP